MFIQSVLLVLVAAGQTTTLTSPLTPTEANRQIKVYRSQLEFNTKSRGELITRGDIDFAVKKHAQKILAPVKSDQVSEETAMQWVPLFELAGRDEDVLVVTGKVMNGRDEKQQYTAAFRAQCKALERLHRWEDLAKGVESFISPPRGTWSAMVHVMMDSHLERIYSSLGAKRVCQILDLAISSYPEMDYEAEAQKRLVTEKAREAGRRPSPNRRSDEERLASLRKGGRQLHLRPLYEAVRFKGLFLLRAGEKVEALNAMREFADAHPDSGLESGIKATLIQFEQIGQSPLPLTVEALKGEFAGLDALRGKVVIVDFDRLPQTPARDPRKPELEQLYGSLHDQGLEIVSVVDTKLLSQSRQGKLVDQVSYAWPLVHGDAENAKQYGLQFGFRMSLIIDRKGKVRFINSARSVFRGTHGLREQVEELLREK